MSLYAAGDLQGCLTPLTTLLDHVGFDPAHDKLWLTGDLVNRGPNSIGCLAFVK
uniref:metallophosphoesterase n=1 Tax=Reinekea sp. TaxID=1970455 RepID=UPI002A7F9422